MTIRTRLPVVAVAVTGLVLAGCVQPATRSKQIDLAPPTAVPNFRPAPALPQDQLPDQGVTIGSGERQWLPGVDLSKIQIRPVGPEADPYLQHYPPALPVPSGEAVIEGLAWSVPNTAPSEGMWLSGTDLRAISIAPLGPEADPTLQHMPAVRLAEKSWLPGVDLRLIDLTRPGPEADPMLTHFSGVVPMKPKAMWLPGVDLRTILIAPLGPMADPTLQHRPANFAQSTARWLSGTDLRLIRINPPGPEADPYLQHVP